VRRRLELLVTAMYGRVIHIQAASAAPSGGWLRRLGRRPPRHLRGRDPLATAGLDALALPPALPADAGVPAALARYRLLAVQQAERLARGTALHAPGAGDALVRDLYLVAEGAAVDAALAAAAPPLAAPLAQARAGALAARPPLQALTAPERAVEALVRQVLGADPRHPPAAVDAPPGPAGSLAWALETAARLRDGRYRGTAPVAFWGTVPPAIAADHAAVAAANDLQHRLTLPVPGARARAAAAGETGDGTGLAAPEPASRAPRIEDARGTPEAGEPEPAAEDPGGATERPPDEPRPLAPSPDAGGGRDGGPPPPPEGYAAAIPYPEWDYRAGAYRQRGALVLPCAAAEGDAAWVDAVLSDHAAVVRRVRQRFEPLRARRARLDRQRHGDDLDLAACVRALVDHRTGHTADDRLYAAVRPARRALAIAILVDVSGSTDALVSPGRQVIDVEKEALVLAGEALDALGDSYAILTFASRGAEQVRLTTIKGFGERSGSLVRRRIAAIRPTGNTRLGAAVRHTTKLLATQPAGHRLLLVLSDGKPNDIDHYVDRYAVEDARRAVLEARAEGVYPFCLTVDREEPDYLSHLFGPAAHTILRRADQLPLALVGVVRQLLTR
jgi:nitric oxide reductase NorD protein